jgi:hypothetical protein
VTFFFGLRFLENLLLNLVPYGLDLQVRFSFCNSNGHLVDFWFLGCFLLLKCGCWKLLKDNSLVKLFFFFG